LGIWLTDLTFIDEGNPNLVDSLVNWRKRELIANIIEEIGVFQKWKYELAEAPPHVVAFLEDLPHHSKDQLVPRFNLNNTNLFLV
jgi:hypothetical protein